MDFQLLLITTSFSMKAMMLENPKKKQTIPYKTGPYLLKNTYYYNNKLLQIK